MSLEAMHSLLKHQLTRHFGDSFTVPENWRAFVSAVDDTYRGFDTDRGMLERSLDLSSQELLQANSEMRAVFQAIPDLIFWLDGEGTILDYTAGETGDFFIQPQELVGKRIQDVPVPKVADDFRNAIRHVRDTKSMKSLEYRMVIQDRVLWYEARLLPLLENRIIVLIRNINERKEAEQRLLESEQQLECIVQGSPIAAFVISKDHKVTHWNRALERLTGIKSNEMRGGKEHWKAFHADGGPGMADFLVDEDFEAISRWRKEGYLRSRVLDEAFESTKFFPKLGEQGKWLHCTTAAIRDSNGAMVGAIATFEDITERKNAQEALAAAEEKFRSIFENAVDGIFQTTLDGRILSVNSAFAAILGYDSPQEVLEKLTDMGSQVYVQPAQRAELLRLVEERGVVREFEVRFYRKDKSNVWVTLNVRSVRDEEGEILYLEGSAQDITDRKILESRLYQRQKMDAIGTLAGGIAHDFNNLLAPVLGFTEMALNKLPENSQLRTNLEQVLKSANRAKNLVKQILAFSRQAEYERKPIQMSVAVQETLQLIRASLPSTIEIKCDIAGDAASSAVLADPTQIHQVIMNLCVNAGHAMRERGGRLEVSLCNEDVRPFCRHAAQGH